MLAVHSTEFVVPVQITTGIFPLRGGLEQITVCRIRNGLGHVGGVTRSGIIGHEHMTSTLPASPRIRL